MWGCLIAPREMTRRISSRSGNGGVVILNNGCVGTDRYMGVVRKQATVEIQSCHRKEKKESLC
jgi:hypothetical protein